MIYHHGRATVELVKTSRRYREIRVTGSPVASRKSVHTSNAKAEFRATCALVRIRAADEHGRVIAFAKSFKGKATTYQRDVCHISRKGRKSYRSQK